MIVPAAEAALAVAYSPAQEKNIYISSNRNPALAS